MKKLTTVVLGLSALVLPLTLAAGEIKLSQNEGTIIERGINLNVNGTITKKSENGTWVVDGKEVFVDKDTFISAATNTDIGDTASLVVQHQYGKAFVISVN